MNKIGPNVKRLIAHRMSVDAVPSGGGFASAVDFLLSGKLAESAQSASLWVRDALALVKSAPDNPYGDDDEAIAGALLQRIEAR